MRAPWRVAVCRGVMSLAIRGEAEAVKLKIANMHTMYTLNMAISTRVKRV